MNEKIYIESIEKTAIKNLCKPFFSFVATYIISLISLLYSNTYVGNILSICLVGECSLLLAGYCYLATKVVEQYCEIVIIPVKKASFVAFIFYLIILIIYTSIFSIENDYIGARSLLYTLTVTFLILFIKH